MAKHSFEIGQLFLVPNSSGSFYVGQVAEEFPELSSVFCYFFDEPDAGQCPSTEAVAIFSKSIIAAALVTPELLKCGVWRLCDAKYNVTQHPLLLRVRELGSEGFVGATVNGAGLVTQFLDTHFGRLSMDHWATPQLVLRFLEASSGPLNS